MGCKIKSGRFNRKCSGLTLNTSHCSGYDPGDVGVTFTYTEYPQATIRTGNYNIPDREHNFVMYNSIAISSGRFGGSQPVSSANCGKVTRVSSCDSNTTLYFDYFPSELSFDYNFSDRFISYLYDTSDEAGVVGFPAYYIEDRSQSRTGGTDGGGNPLADSYESDSVCHPCTAFTCTAASTNLSYTCDRDYTGDPDCPHPTLFGFGTDSTKIAFSYDELSTQVPNGVTDIELSYDGVTFTDVWDEDELEGTPYTTSQNTWQSGDESLDDFTIYELDGEGATSGFRVKVRIRPDFDDSGANVVFNGTEWEITEILSPGSGYTVGDEFTLNYVHTHPDNTSTTFTVTLKVSGVGSIDGVAGQSGFDVLRTGDTLNGHELLRVVHFDEQNFPYHVAYLDGNGNNFAKDTQYTSGRDHEVTVVAGFGVADRAILLGKYEFGDKSMQYVTADVSKSAPDIYNDIKQPEVTVSLTNGRVTGTNIVDGGAGWDELTEEPILAITPPIISSGRQAKLKGTFSGGVLQSIEIEKAGSGYSDDNPPQVFVQNNYESREEKFTAPDDNDFLNETEGILKSIPSAGDVFVDIDALKASDPVTYNRLTELGFEDDLIISVISKNESNKLRISASTAPSATAEDYQKFRDNYQPLSDVKDKSTIETLSNQYEQLDLETETPGFPKNYGDYTSSLETVDSISVSDPKPTIEVKMDPDRRRVETVPQRLYSRDAAQFMYEVVEPKYNLSFLEKDEILDGSIKKILIDELARTTQERKESIDNIIQDSIPETVNLKESFVETVQGPLSELPKASTYTKYLMTQYRADPARDTEISINLSMTPVNVGKSHFTCTAPAGQTGGVVNNADGSTTTTTYTMSSLQGPGCQPWSISGTMKIFHDLSSAAQTASDAGEAYGNPYDIT